MRLVYVLGLLSLIGVGALWCGWYGLMKRRLAAALAAVCVFGGGALLLLAVLPTYSFYGPTVTQHSAAGKSVASPSTTAPIRPILMSYWQFCSRTRSKLPSL